MPADNLLDIYQDIIYHYILKVISYKSGGSNEENYYVRKQALTGLRTCERVSFRKWNRIFIS